MECMGCRGEFEEQAAARGTRSVTPFVEATHQRLQCPDGWQDEQGGGGCC